MLIRNQPSFEHMFNSMSLNEIPGNYVENIIENFAEENGNEILNCYITEDEILDVVKKKG